MFRSDTRKRVVLQQITATASERRIGHHWHAMSFAPGKQSTFNGAITDVVKNLISCAAIAAWNTEEVLHIIGSEVGDAPGPNLARDPQTFKRCYNVRQI